MKTLDYELQEFKALSDAGEFEGYASIFGNVDMGGDVVKPGAFREFAKTSDGKVRIMLQHRPDSLLGKAEVTENGRGLQFKGKLNLNVPYVRNTYEFMKDGTLDGMSIGYDVLPNGSTTDPKTGVRSLTALKLWEISVVTFGMNQRATITGVKAGEITTIREFENFLRDAGGYSKADATAVAADGFKALDRRRDAGEEDTAVNDALMTFIKARRIQLLRKV